MFEARNGFSFEKGPSGGLDVVVRYAKSQSSPIFESCSLDKKQFDELLAYLGVEQLEDYQGEDAPEPVAPSEEDAPRPVPPPAEFLVPKAVTAVTDEKPAPDGEHGDPVSHEVRGADDANEDAVKD